MFNHEPKNYTCPFCQLAQGGESKYNSQQDLIYRDELALALVSPRWWPNNLGHVLIVSNEHFENIYDLPPKYAHRIQDIAREVAIAFKEVYNCDGVSTRQHNEPAGDQEVWHYHLHVFPRYKDDNLYQSIRAEGFVPAYQRAAYATKLREYLRSKALYFL